MNNVKKLLAVLIVVTMLVTAMIPVMAADASFSYEDEAQVLADLGLMIGDGTDLDLDGELTREMGAILLVRLLGAEKDAKALTDAKITAALKDYTDKEDISSWADEYVAYATEAGFLTGRDDGSLDPKANLLGKDYCTMILRAMGYEVSAADWAIAASILVEKDGLSTAEAIKFNDKALIRDAAAGITYAALSGEVKAGGTLIAALVAAKAVDADDAVASGLYKKPAAAPLTVDSLSANNLKEIVVNFNKALDKTSAETAANYTLSLGGAVSKAVMNGNSVTLTATNAIANQAKVSVTVTANVKDAAGVAIVATTKDITLFDATIPVALSYSFTGPQTIEILFSEPINANGSALVDNGIYGAAVAVHATKNNVAVVSLGTPLPEGTHTLKITGTTDFAGYTAQDKVFDITYTKDITLPVASLTSVTQTKAVIKFNKEVKNLDVKNFYHTYTAYAPDSITNSLGGPIVAGEYYDTVVVNFTNKPIPSGVSNVVVLKTANSVSITDRYGNVMASDAVLVASVATDVVAPTISKVAATAENTVVVTFSEDVVGAATKANYVFKKADGTVLAASTYGEPVYANGTTCTATITFTAALAGGAYSVEVSNIKDASLSANPMGTVAQPFTVTDKTAIATATSIAVENPLTTADIVYVTYPENMATTGVNSVLELANYKIGTSGAAYAGSALALPTGSKIEVFGTTNRVKVTIPGISSTDLSGKSLFVRNIADASGNIFTNLFIEVVLTADSAPVITKVKSIAKNTFELYVNKELSALNASNILIGVTPVAQATYVNKTDGTSVITVIVPAGTELANEGSTFGIANPGFTITNAGLIKSLTGTAMLTDSNLFVNNGGNEVVAVFADGVAPAVYRVDFVNVNTIRVTFTEPMNVLTIAGAGKNGFSVTGGTLTSALSTSATEITLTGTAFTIDTDVLYTGTNGITDASGNALAAISRTAVLTNP